MAENNMQAQRPAMQSKAPQDELSLKQLAQLSIAHWWWFVISIFLCLGFSFIYLMRTQPTYTRTSSVLIKENSTRPSNFGAENFENMLNMKSNADNELVAIKSPALILELVRQMHMDVNYQKPGFMRSHTLYGPNLPATVNFLDLNDADVLNLNLQISDDKLSYTLSNITYNGEQLSGELKGALGDTLQSPFGQVVVAATPYLHHLETRSYNVSRRNIYSAAGSVSARLKADFTSKMTTIINLTFTDTSIARAEEVLNTLVALYNKSWVNDKNQIAISTSQFINERLTVIESELGHVDSDISSYKSQNLIPDVQAVSSMYMSQASSANNAIQQLNNQLYMTRVLQGYVSSDANATQLLPSNSGINNNNIEALISSYNQKMLERNNLASNSSVNNPLVKDADKALAELRNNIRLSLENHVTALNTQIQAQDRLARQSTAGIANNPVQAKDLLSVERQQKVKESLYLFLLQKREENELSQAFTAYNTRIVTPPMGPMGPTSPVRNRILLIAFALGIAIPLGLIYLLEVTYTKVRGRKDIEHLSVPFIGELPQGDQAKNKRQQAQLRYTIQVNAKSTNAINEAFRILRTNLEYMSVAGTTKRPQVIMTTSANVSSGKTYVSMNLAAACALNGKKCICIDLDLRKGSLSRYVGRPKPGVSEYLTGTISDWKSAIVELQEYNNLAILPTGHMPPNPSELLYSPRLAQLIEELRSEYDYVFLDCPPHEMVADASIIAKHAELTLFVVRIGIMEREYLKVVEDIYQNKRLPNMAILLNGAEHTSRYGYHRYGYGYGYGYGYHYGYGNEKKKK